MSYIESIIWVFLGLFAILGGAQKLPSKVMQEAFNSVSLVPMKWNKYLGACLVAYGIYKLL